MSPSIMTANPAVIFLARIPSNLQAADAVNATTHMKDTTAAAARNTDAAHSPSVD
jgi:hypothetical protein